MSEHTIDSPTWGPLRVSVTQDNKEPARPWRAVLLERPARLSHLVQTVGATEEEALGVLTLTVERYSPTGMAVSTPRGMR